jgi:thiol-disulfide isomerase/thioredoxin
MNKIIIGFLVLTLVGGGVWWLVQKDSMATDTIPKVDSMTPMAEKKAMVPGEMMKKDTAEDTMGMAKNDTMPPQKDGMMQKSGSYVAYDANKLQAATGTRILFFHAAWCPTCRAVDADIVKNAQKIPAEVSIFKVNYDDATDLKKKYGVTYQHTFVMVDAEGNALKTWSGSPTLEKLLTMQK